MTRRNIRKLIRGCDLDVMWTYYSQQSESSNNNIGATDRENIEQTNAGNAFFEEGQGGSWRVPAAGRP